MGKIMILVHKYRFLFQNLTSMILSCTKKGTLSTNFQQSLEGYVYSRGYVYYFLRYYSGVSNKRAGFNKRAGTKQKGSPCSFFYILFMQSLIRASREENWPKNNKRACSFIRDTRVNISCLFDGRVLTLKAGAVLRDRLNDTV